MKCFARTKKGKVILFVSCMFSLFFMVLCLGMTYVMLQEGAYLPMKSHLFVQFWLVRQRGVAYSLMKWAYANRYLMLILCPLLLALSAWLYKNVLAGAGRQSDDEAIRAGFLQRVPLEIVLAGTALLAWLGYLVVGWLCEHLIYYLEVEPIVMLLLLLLLSAVFLFLSKDIAIRIKGRTLLKNTLIARLIRLAAAVTHKVPLIWKTLLLAAVLFFVQIGLWENSIGRSLAYSSYYTASMIVTVLVALVLIVSALMQKRLEKSAAALAQGQYGYRTETTGLVGVFRKHGENLNHIADGLEKAVEARLKGERMKTELITNVSHDLKTPLTSVVNYATLISREPCENEKIREYADVLLKQSDRLTRLINDLVEAARASSGDLEVELVPCEAGVLLTQIAGEYEQRMREAGLSLITRFPDHPVHILADSRRMWRVFDNLMDNACKYAMPGTRVYLNLSQVGQMVQIAFINISKEPLNISADELMERFVRGDVSRSTEGNGLGLSIARSLTELQGGRLTLEIEGDQFKVTLFFPAAS